MNDEIGRRLRPHLLTALRMQHAQLGAVLAAWEAIEYGQIGGGMDVAEPLDGPSFEVRVRRDVSQPAAQPGPIEAAGDACQSLSAKKKVGSGSAAPHRWDEMRVQTLRDAMRAGGGVREIQARLPASWGVTVKAVENMIFRLRKCERDLRGEGAPDSPQPAADEGSAEEPAAPPPAVLASRERIQRFADQHLVGKGRFVLGEVNAFRQSNGLPPFMIGIRASRSDVKSFALQVGLRSDMLLLVNPHRRRMGLPLFVMGDEEDFAEKSEKGIA